MRSLVFKSKQARKRPTFPQRFRWNALNLQSEQWKQIFTIPFPSDLFYNKFTKGKKQQKKKKKHGKWEKTKTGFALSTLKHFLELLHSLPRRSIYIRTDDRNLHSCSFIATLLYSSFLVINIFRVAFRGAQPNISVLQPVCYEAGDWACVVSSFVIHSETRIMCPPHFWFITYNPNYGYSKHNVFDMRRNSTD